MGSQDALDASDAISYDKVRELTIAANKECLDSLNLHKLAAKLTILGRRSGKDPVESADDTEGYCPSNDINHIASSEDEFEIVSKKLKKGVRKQVRSTLTTVAKEVDKQVDGGNTVTTCQKVPKKGLNKGKMCKNKQLTRKRLV